MSNTSTESGDMTGVTAPKLPQGCETRISRVVADEAGATIIGDGGYCCSEVTIGEPGGSTP